MGERVVSTIHSLPLEIFCEILVKTTTNNFTDIFSAKRACKLLNQAVNDPLVYKNVSLEHLVEVGWKKPVITEEDIESYNAFWKKCLDSGNLEALYKEGVENVFQTHSVARVSIGIQALSKASDLGSAHCRYVLGILCLLDSDGVVKVLGQDIIRDLTRPPNSQTMLDECRRKLGEFLASRWLFDRALWQYVPLCDPSNHHYPNHPWAELGPLEWDTTCLGCQCDEEIGYFLRHFPEFY